MRVSITQDQTDDGKLIVTLSKPLKQKDKDKFKNIDYTLTEGFSDPSGLPIVLNPSMPKSADVLQVWIVNDGKKHNIKIGSNKVTQMSFENDC